MDFGQCFYCKTCGEEVMGPQDAEADGCEVCRDSCDVQCGDSVVEENVKFLRDRSTVGQRKYGVTLDRDDLSPVEWVQHLREELADALNYATVVQRKMNDE